MSIVDEAFELYLARNPGTRVRKPHVLVCAPWKRPVLFSCVFCGRRDLGELGLDGHASACAQAYVDEHCAGVLTLAEAVEMHQAENLAPVSDAWVYDDGGREAAGFKGEARDCVARAIAIAAEIPYGRVHHELLVRASKAHLVRNRKSPDRGVASVVYQPYLAELGFLWTPKMGIGTGCRVHLRCDELPAGRLIARCSVHLVAVVDGVVRDTHDSTRDGTRCVYGYWARDAAVDELSEVDREPALRVRRSVT